jgi:hypothetical protein
VTALPRYLLLDPPDLGPQFFDIGPKLGNPEGIEHKALQPELRLAGEVVIVVQHIGLLSLPDYRLDLGRTTGIADLTRHPAASHIAGSPRQAVGAKIARLVRGRHPRAGPPHFKVAEMTLPLMPKATAVWLIEKTSLTFKQIAEFCGMHPLEVQAIADGEVAQGIVGYDPVANGQVTFEEIHLCERNPERPLHLSPAANPLPKRSRGSRYTPVSKRNDRPDAIAFLLHSYPQLSDAQISKLLGTTKETIQKVRDKSHWNSANIKRRDPVTIGLCTQTDLNAVVAQANERESREITIGSVVPEPEADRAA